MGTCLITNSNNFISKTTENMSNSSQNIRCQIQAQLQQPSKEVQSIKSVKDSRNNDQKSILTKSRSIIKNDSKVSNSSKAIPSGCGIKNKGSSDIQKIRQNSRSLKNASIKKQANVSLKQITQKNSLREATLKSSSYSIQQSQNSFEKDQQNKEEVEQYVQTPQSRKIHLDKDMILKGLTESDNKMINLTLVSNGPIRLSQIRFTNKSVYTGEWLSGMRHGAGILNWDDGSTYEGLWKNNMSEGRGRIQFTDGQSYEGDWKQNKCDGYGTYVFNNGSVYTGHWKDDLQEGSGTETWKNGERYIGAWSNGKKNGYGQLYFEDGSYYKGTFFSNEIHGQGVYCWQKIKIYNGQWQHNRMNGRGVMIWENGDQYQGIFKNDKMQGFGSYKCSDGCSCMGNWQNGRKHGIFTQKDSDGKIKQSQWHMGKRLKSSDEQQKWKGRKYKRSQETKTTISVKRSV